MKNYIFVVLLMATTCIFAQENQTNNQKWKGSRPDGHAPIGVMGDHVHSKGEFMFSYRFMYMNMEDLKRGNDDVEVGNALVDYMVTPYKMPMKMHMLGAMHAPTNNLTLMAMIQVVSKEMDHVARMGKLFSTETSGLGDTKISGLYKIFDKNHTLLHADLGVSIPTGSIDEKDITPMSMGNEVVVPYSMQNGSGTFDIKGGFTFLWQIGDFSGGNQLEGIFRTGENDNGYKLGNRYSLNNWFALKANDLLSFSLRFKGEHIGKIDGANPDLNPMMVITADTVNSGGNIIDGSFGVNFYVPNGDLKNLRFGAEISHPLYQDLNGVQLKLKETFTVGVQYSH
jgi:hypothetical protein